MVDVKWFCARVTLSKEDAVNVGSEELKELSVSERNIREEWSPRQRGREPWSLLCDKSSDMRGNTHIEEGRGPWIDEVAIINEVIGREMRFGSEP